MFTMLRLVNELRFVVVIVKFATMSYQHIVLKFGTCVVVKFDFLFLFVEVRESFGGWWLVSGDWWMVVGGWWLVDGGC